MPKPSQGQVLTLLHAVFDSKVPIALAVFQTQKLKDVLNYYKQKTVLGNYLLAVINRVGMKTRPESKPFSEYGAVNQRIFSSVLGDMQYANSTMADAATTIAGLY